MERRGLPNITAFEPELHDCLPPAMPPVDIRVQSAVGADQVRDAEFPTIMPGHQVMKQIKGVDVAQVEIP